MTLMALLLATRLAVGAEGRFWAMLRDGTQVTGDSVNDLNDPERNPTLGDRPLFDAGNSVRVIRDTTRDSQLRGPYVEFANGDVLPGKIVCADGLLAGDQIQPHLVVLPGRAIPLPGRESTDIRVRQSAVKRIAFTPRGHRPYQPGKIFYRDGREATCTNVRWSAGAVRALTHSGVVTAGLDELAELHLPQRDIVSVLIEDGTWPAVQNDELIVSVCTTDGGRFTYPRSMVHAGFDDDRHRKITSIGIQPSWSLDAIRLTDDSIVFRTYRRSDEIPLSLLPVSHVEQRAALHAWPWRRNRNVLGTMLRVGNIAADLGMGTHSHTEITFDLPPCARRFSALVGLDTSAGDGGCVKCTVYRGQVGDRPLFASDFLVGSQQPVPVGPLDVRDAQRLTLVTEFGHKDRPPGTDPLDIRDHVDWLMPWISVDLSAMERRELDLSRWFAPLDGWTADKETSERISVHPWWNHREGRWAMAMAADADKSIADAEPLELTRRVRVALSNAYVHVAAGRDRADSARHFVHLLVDGEPQETTVNGDLSTNAGPGDVNDRVWMLGDHIGKDVTISLRLMPEGDAGTKPAGIVWGSISLRPLIDKLPTDGEPIRPDVPLTSLEPIDAVARGGEKIEIQLGELPDGSPLSVCGYRFPTGFGVRAGASVSYELKPSYRRFVAVLGLADGWKEVGPYEVLLDDEPHWTSTEPRTFGRNTPGLQIDVPIPRGHKTIQLRLQGSESHGAWAAAGFLLE